MPVETVGEEPSALSDDPDSHDDTGDDTPMGARATENRSWKGIHLADDIDQVNFTDSDDPLRRLEELLDRRAGDQLGEPPAHFADVPVRAQQKLIDGWRAEVRPGIDESLWPFAKKPYTLGGCVGRW